MNKKIPVSRYQIRKMTTEGCIICGSKVVTGFQGGLECMGCRKHFVAEAVDYNMVDAVAVILRDGTDLELNGNGQQAITTFLTKAMHFCHRENIPFDFVLDEAREAFERKITEETAAEQRRKEEEEAKNFFLDLAGSNKDSLVMLMQMTKAAIEKKDQPEVVVEAHADEEPPLELREVA